MEVVTNLRMYEYMQVKKVKLILTKELHKRGLSCLKYVALSSGRGGVVQITKNSLLYCLNYVLTVYQLFIKY